MGVFRYVERSMLRFAQIVPSASPRSFFEELYIMAMPVFLCARSNWLCWESRRLPHVSQSQAPPEPPPRTSRLGTLSVGSGRRRTGPYSRREIKLSGGIPDRGACDENTPDTRLVVTNSLVVTQAPTLQHPQQATFPCATEDSVFLDPRPTPTMKLHYIGVCATPSHRSPVPRHPEPLTKAFAPGNRLSATRRSRRMSWSQRRSSARIPDSHETSPSIPSVGPGRPPGAHSRIGRTMCSNGNFTAMASS